MPDTSTETLNTTANTGGTRRQHKFTPEEARAAAQKSVEVRKAKAEQRRLGASSIPASASGELPDGTVGVVVPLSYVEVIRTLQRAALGGDVSAARELRAWKEAHPEVNEHVSLEEQPAVLRDRLLRRLIAEEKALLEGEGDAEESTETVSPLTDHPRDAGQLGAEASPPKGEGVPCQEEEAPQGPTYSENEVAQNEHTAPDAA